MDDVRSNHEKEKDTMKTEITDELLETLKGIKEGKKWQIRILPHWDWQDVTNPEYSPFRALSMNEKVRLKPEPQTVPWTMEDVEPGMVFRMKGKETWRYPQVVSNVDIFFSMNTGNVTWERLKMGWEWSKTAKENDWHPCEKEVVS